MKLVAFALLAGKAAAECPNACSGHGNCGAYDECTCYFNWQGGDCGYRTCPFALAHVDTPKGDLDGSADPLSSIHELVVVDSTVYPYGTHEQYPRMMDSTGAVLENTAHSYMECGNKGLCDRGSGECDCFPGYEGAGCQRASCPDPICSGHGTCQSALELARLDYDNEYLLWDREVSMGCKCEPGYSGPTCADKICKYGVDPLYIDDPYMSIRAATARVVIMTDETLNFNTFNPETTETTPQDADAEWRTTDYTDPLQRYLDGTYAIKFYDVFGEDWITDPIRTNSTCLEIQTALEGLPNNVIPAGTTECRMQNTADDDHITYDLEFHGTPGDLKPIEIDIHRDGSRPSVYFTLNDTFGFNVSATVFPNYYGVSGEFVDYFSQYCHNVAVTMADNAVDSGVEGQLGFSGTRGYLKNLDPAEVKLLKKCLGDANGDDSDNVEVYDWDYGIYNETLFPHIVKIAPVPEYMDDDYDAGKFYLLWYASNVGKFLLGNHPHELHRQMSIFTTDGVATVMTNITSLGNFNGKGVTDGPGITYGEVTARFDKGSTIVYTSIDTSCYTGALSTCLSKEDKIFLFDANWPTGFVDETSGTGSIEVMTPQTDTGNMYTVKKIGVNKPSPYTNAVEDRYYLVLDKAVNWDGSATISYFELYGGGETDALINGYKSLDSFTDIEVTAAQLVGAVRIIKFEPALTGNFEYVKECSGRGLCDKDSGLCECFTGYTGDNCGEQNALAV